VVSCFGYVAADLVLLVRHAKLPRLFQEVTKKYESVGLTIHPLNSTTKEVVTSALQEASLAVSSTKQILEGGAKTLLCQAIDWLYSRHCAYKCLGLTPPHIILLHSPSWWHQDFLGK
jgi:SpoVK/Ycf46/Vps4 family AAA+-type ATPase